MESELKLNGCPDAIQFVLPYCGWRELLTLEQACSSLCSWVKDPWLWRHLAIEPPQSQSISSASVLRLVKRAKGDLKTFRVAQNPNLTVEAIECVLSASPHLEQLAVPYCPRVIVCHVIDIILARFQLALSIPSPKNCNKTPQLATNEGVLFVSADLVLCDDVALHDDVAPHATTAALPPQLGLRRLHLRGCYGTREEDDNKLIPDVHLNEKFNLMCDIMRRPKGQRCRDMNEISRLHTETPGRNITSGGGSEVMDAGCGVGGENTSNDVESDNLRRQLLPVHVEPAERKDPGFIEEMEGPRVDVDVGICPYCAELRILCDKPKTFEEISSTTEEGVQPQACISCLVFCVCCLRRLNPNRYTQLRCACFVCYPCRILSTCGHCDGRVCNIIHICDD